MSTPRRPAPWLTPAEEPSADEVEAPAEESPGGPVHGSAPLIEAATDAESTSESDVAPVVEESGDTAEMEATSETVALDQVTSLDVELDRPREPVGRQLFTGAERRKHYDEPLSIFDDRPVPVAPVVGRQDRWVAAGEAVAAFIADEEEPVIS